MEKFLECWGIKRGFFSNDAGNGMSPLISATTDTSHPVKQGLVQGLSVYIDTLLVCTCTGISILLAGTYNVAADGAGASLLVEHVPGIQYGIAFMQEAMSVSIGKAFLQPCCPILISWNPHVNICSARIKWWLQLCVFYSWYSACLVF